MEPHTAHQTKQLESLSGQALPPYINALTISETSEFINKSGAKVVFTGHGGDEGISHRCNVYEMFYYTEYYHFFRYMWSLSHGQKGRIFKTLKSSYEKIKELNKETEFFTELAIFIKERDN